VPDRPGGLAGLLETVAAVGANVIELSHLRDDATLPLAQTGVELLVELRGCHGRHERDDAGGVQSVARRNWLTGSER
jgi:threonine dehydratase